MAKRARGTADAGPRPAETLAQGLAVLRTFDATHARAAVGDIADRAGVTVETAEPLLGMLTDLGYLREEGGAWELTPRVLDIGFGYLAALPLCDVAPPHLDDLARTVAQSASVSVLDGGDIVYVARSQARRIRTVSITVGTRFPAWVTSMGRVLLAALPEDERAAVLDRVELLPVTPRTIVDRDRLDGELRKIARQGWALLDGELEIGARSLAAPLHGPDGSVVGAVNVAMGPLDEPDRLLVPLLGAATAIATALARRPEGGGSAGRLWRR